MISLLRALGGRPKKPLKSVTYDAIVFKRFTTRSATCPDSTLINYVWRNVFAKEDMIVDSEAMRVGNREGLGWMERMDRDLAKFTSDLKAQKTINERLNMANEQQKLRWCGLRIIEVEKKTPFQSEEAMLAREERNQTIHGGNIIEDLEAINYMKDKVPQVRYHSSRKGFEAWYEVPFRYKDQIEHAPELVIRTFNNLADTKSLWRQSNDPNFHEVQKNCRGIISRWLEWVDAGEGEYPDAHIRRELEKLESLKSG